MQVRTYLVTGGLGFLGRPLVRALLSGGHRVRILDNMSRGSPKDLGETVENVEFISGDIRDPEVVDRSVRGVDSVCHLAFVNGTRYFYEKPAYVLDVGVKGIINVLDACIRREVGELILASSSEVYQAPSYVPTDEAVPLSVPDILNPRYSYGGGKIISELMAINYGRDYLDRVIIFRPHNVFGPNMGWDHVIPEFIVRLQSLRPASNDQEIAFPIQGTGEQLRSFIYIDDFIAGLMLVIGRGEHLRIYNTGTAEELKIKDLAHQIARCLGMRIRIVPGREALGGTPRRCPDIRKLQQLGFKPQFPFSEALSLTVQWYKDRLLDSQATTAAEAAEVFVKDK